MWNKKVYYDNGSVDVIRLRDEETFEYLQFMRARGHNIIAVVTGTFGWTD